MSVFSETINMVHTQTYEECKSILFRILLGPFFWIHP